MNRQRVYIDTSVFGGCFEPQFEEASSALFAEIRENRRICVLSVLTLGELKRGPDHIRYLTGQLPFESLEIVRTTPSARELARAYLSAGVLTPKSRFDALHVAVATLERVDILVSWNYKHIVNLQRIRGFSGVNLLHGYAAIEIRTPSEVVLRSE